MSSRGHKLLEAQMAAYQPKSFAFTSENEKKAKAIIAKYPKGKQQSALMPLLTIAQEQSQNWLPVVAMDYVADYLQIPRMRAYEVATFYTMYNLEPVGEYFIEVCTTTPCWLRGSDEIVRTCKEELGIGIGETTPDGKFTLVEVECLCACANAPVIQVGQHYYEDLEPETTRSLLQNLRNGNDVKPGPQGGRRAAEPAEGLTSLTQQVEKPKQQKESATEKKSTKAHESMTPNKPSEDTAKGRPKDVRSPAVADKVPTKDKPAAKASKAKTAEKAKPKSSAAKKKPAPKKKS